MAGDTVSTRPHALREWDAIADTVGDRAVAVFLDFDGTLSPIVDDPDEAELPNATRDAVARLARVCPVAIVSGRDTRDVARRVAVDDVSVAGSHGFEILGPGGLHHEHPDVAATLPALDAAEDTLRDRLADEPGVVVERKRFGLSVHDRMVPEHRVDEVRQMAEEAGGSDERLRVTHGKRVTELRPAIDWHKGRAVEWLADALELGDRALLVYVGDDTTDEDAFRVVADAGVGIVVGDPAAEDGRESEASYSLDDPEEVRELVARLATHLEERDR